MTIPHYWNPQQVERLLDSLAALGLRRARVVALIMWRSGLRVGETVALEWRDIDVTGDQRQLVLAVATTILPVTCGNHPVQEVPDWLRISKSHY